MNKRNSFIISLLLSFPLLCSASLPNLEIIELDSSVYSFNEGENFIEEFKVEEKELNSSLHPILDQYEIHDLYYIKNYGSSYKSNYTPEFQFNDVLYDEDQGGDVFYIDIDGTEHAVYDSFISYGNGNYYSYQRKSNIAFDENYGSYYFEQSYDGTCYDLSGSGETIKSGFSSVQGVSLISNDIYINSIFNKNSYKNNSYIDLALVNESSYSIEFEELLNVLSYSSPNAQIQFPIIKMDDEELVNLICNGSNAYLVTHNCEFSFSEDNNKFYLSIPYREYIEKITISIPFFTGGFSDYLVSQDMEGNTLPYAYLVGTEIRNEIYEVLTGFKPYLFNDDINNSSSKYVNFSPITIEDIDLENNKLIVKSIIPGSFTNLNKIKFKKEQALSIIYFESTLSNPILKEESTRLFVQHEAEFFNDYYKYSIDISPINLNSTSFVCIEEFNYSFNLTDTYIYINNLVNPDDKKFNYYNDRTAKIITTGVNYELIKNPTWWETWFNNIGAQTTGSFYSTWYCNGVNDEYDSYREFLYFDFYWDETMENKIESIESMHVVIPKNNNSSLEIKENNLQYRIDDFNKNATDNEQFFVPYDSSISGYYNAFVMDFDSSNNEEKGLKFNEYGRRFLYTNYCGKEKYKTEDSSYPADYKLRFGVDRKAILEENKIQATLLVYINADTLVKATSNKDGLHVEFDDTGKYIGVFDGAGNQNDDYYFDEESGFIKDVETDEILGDNNTIVEDNTSDNVYDDLSDKNFFDDLSSKYNEFINKLNDFTNNLSHTFKLILAILVLILFVFLIIKIASAIKGLVFLKATSSYSRKRKRKR